MVLLSVSLEEFSISSNDFKNCGAQQFIDECCVLLFFSEVFMFYFVDFLKLFFDCFYFILETPIFLMFLYTFFATGIVILAQKLFKMVLSV